MLFKSFVCRAAFVLLCIIATNIPTARGQSKLEADEFEQILSKIPDIQVLDVRTPQEFNQGHISRCLNININDAEFKSKIAELDKTKPVAVYCAGGVRSAKAANIISQMGFRLVFDLQGGITAWNGKGKLLVR